MTVIMVDIESDGPIPGDYSMIALGAVIVDDSLNKTFYGQFKPISDQWQADALAVSGFTREQTLAFDDPLQVMKAFADWLASHCSSSPRFGRRNASTSCRKTG